MKLTSAIALILLGALSLISLNAEWTPIFKNIQGPPEEFSVHNIPRPEEAAMESDYTSINAFLTQSETQNGLFVYETSFPVDAESEEHSRFRLNLVTTLPLDKISTLIRTPDSSEWRRLDPSTGISGWFGMSTSSEVPTLTFEWAKPIKGVWHLRLESTESPQNIPNIDIPSRVVPHVTILLENDSPYRVQSHLQSYKLRVNEQVGLKARLFDEREYHAKLASLTGRNSLNRFEAAELLSDPSHQLPLPTPIASSRLNNFKIEMDVVLPNGKEKRVAMHDDGLHGDNDANDGIYSASITAEVPGFYFAEVQVSGETPEGHVFSRTTHHMFSVVDQDEDLTFVSHAHGSFDQKTSMLTLELPLRARMVKSIIGKKFKAYAEVWGADSSKNEAAVAFVAGMSIAQQSKNHGDSSVVVLPLKLHVNWLWRANAAINGRFVLRNLYVQDVTNSIPLAEAQQVELLLNEENRIKMSQINKAFNGDITEEMKWGPRPSQYDPVLRARRFRANNSTNSGHKILLSHGYCAEDIPFPIEEFDNGAKFVDPNQNRPNDVFAQLLAKRGDEFESFSLIAHSQGGIASLHLLAYYWSGLDLNGRSSDTHRWVQAMGTPFRGTTLASWGDLGKGFGVGCGTNNELTPDGAKLWLSTIPMEAREHVYHYSTQYKPWSWCNVAVNAILSWPNDGVTEQKYVKFEGGNFVLLKEKFCHTTDMKYPAQCLDAVNNGFMNRKAARGAQD